MLSINGTSEERVAGRNNNEFSLSLICEVENTTRPEKEKREKPNEVT